MFTPLGDALAFFSSEIRRQHRTGCRYTVENIQSRIRGALLMALPNKFGALLLTTGNKSETSVGY